MKIGKKFSSQKNGQPDFDNYLLSLRILLYIILILLPVYLSVLILTGKQLIKGALYKQQVHAQTANKKIIVDYSARDLFDKIPANYINIAANLRYLQLHVSVGGNIDQGLNCLQGTHSQSKTYCPEYGVNVYNRSRWYWPKYEEMEPSLSCCNKEKCNAGGCSGCAAGNQQCCNDKCMTGKGAVEKMNFFEERVRQLSNNYDVMSMKFCYTETANGAYPDWNLFDSMIDRLQTTYSNKIFIWWTIPVSVTGDSGGTTFNNLLRQKARNENLILFDIADIESRHGACHNSAGDQTLCADMAADSLGHLNWEGKEFVARMIWVLMAQIAGANFNSNITQPTTTPLPSRTPTPTPSRLLNPSPTVTPKPSITLSPAPVARKTCQLKQNGDANCDNNIDLNDFTIWRSEFLITGGSQKTADFNQDSKVNLIDFEIWRKNHR